MTETACHARAFDLPGWSCPPRVRDIPNHRDSWGLVPTGALGSVAQDELGYLWVDGDAVPGNSLPQDKDANPGAVVCWTESGIGIWVHPKSLKLRSTSRLDMESDRWVPIAVALQELPAFVKA